MDQAFGNLFRNRKKGIHYSDRIQFYMFLTKKLKKVLLSEL